MCDTILFKQVFNELFNVYTKGCKLLWPSFQEMHQIFINVGLDRAFKSKIKVLRGFNPTTN